MLKKQALKAKIPKQLWKCISKVSLKVVFSFQKLARKTNPTPSIDYEHDAGWCRVKIFRILHEETWKSNSSYIGG